MNDAPTKKEYATLRRRPFLTPIWLSALAAVIVVSFMGWLWGTATSTTVIVIRHAEKQSNAGDDPPLTPAGEARASLLARMFGDKHGLGRLDAIYVSPTRRSQLTAAPLANDLKLAVIIERGDRPKLLAHRALREHQGQRVLIVAHSDSIPEIVQTLSGAQLIAPVAADEYDTMYIVTVPRIGHASLLRLKFGN